MSTISNNLFNALTEAEKIHKELGLGLHKSVIRAVEDGQDNLGVYFAIVLEQFDTGLCTAENGSVTRFKDIAKIHRGENRMNSKGYATQRGDGWKRFFDSIYEQKPELEVLGWAKTLELLVEKGLVLNVWYTRSKQGYIGVHFTEGQYRFALNGGATGGDDVGVEGKELNDERPF